MATITAVLVQVQSRAPDRNSSVEALLNICFRGFFHLKETSFLLLISRFVSIFRTNWSFCQESADFIFLPMESSWFVSSSKIYSLVLDIILCHFLHHTHDSISRCVLHGELCPGHKYQPLRVLQFLPRHFFVL